MRKRIFAFALLFALSAVPVFAADNVSSAVSSLIPQSNSNGDAELAIANAEALRQLSDVIAAELAAARVPGVMPPVVPGEGWKYRDAQGVLIGSVIPGNDTIDVLLQDSVCTLGCGPTDRQYTSYHYDNFTWVLTTSTKVIADNGNGATLSTTNVFNSSPDVSARTANNESLAFHWTMGMANMFSAGQTVQAQQPSGREFNLAGKLIKRLDRAVRMKSAAYARAIVPGGYTDVVQFGSRTITKSTVGGYYEIDFVKHAYTAWLSDPAGNVIQTTKQDNPLLWLEAAYATRDRVQEAANQATNAATKKTLARRALYHIMLARTIYKASVVLPNGLALSTEGLLRDIFIIRCGCFTLVIETRSGTMVERNEDTGETTIYKNGQPGYASRINSYLNNVDTAVSITSGADNYAWMQTQARFRRLKTRFGI